MHWCGDFGEDVVVSWAFNPCWFETVAAALLAFAYLVLITCQWTRVLTIQEKRNLGFRGKGLKATDGVYVAGALMLAMLHAVHLVIALIVPWGYAFHVMYHAVALFVWLLFLSLTCWAGQVRVFVDNRPFLVVAALAYTGTVYTYVQNYVASTEYPTVYLKGEVYTALLQSMILISFNVAEFKRQKQAAVERQRLAEGYDTLHELEAQEINQRTWLSLCFDACRFVWPNTLSMQLRVVGALVLLLAMRVLNLAVPILYKEVVDELARASVLPPDERPNFFTLLMPWVAAYLICVFFQGGAGASFVGLLNNIRAYLWVPVSQDAYRRVSLAGFEHVLALDLQFHLRRKTGEVIKIMDRGGEAIQDMLSTLLFSIAPQIFDVLAAATYLSQAMEPGVAAIVFLTVGSYIPLTIIITEWRGSFRRDMNTASNKMGARVTDALLNYETVKYFTNEEYESKQYDTAIYDYQKHEYKFTVAANLLNIVQSMVMFAGTSAGLVLCVYGVAVGTMSVGDSVLFLTFMYQLYAPLNLFGMYYRNFQQQMIDMDNLFQLLDQNVGVKDKPRAKPLRITQGTVQYNDVSFQYEVGREVLKGVSFTVPGGSSIAFVGATGSGKSTVTRLLFRFYDVKSGAILIDGQDIRDVTQTSLRNAISMVPQDTVLFNDTIMHNIRYGRINATDLEVVGAAEAACIHEIISTRFPKGYETVVGERGLRLSGGEKQRVAFARALLKNSPLLVLDEATSALDSITEKKIQSTLRDTRQQRTMLIVAHRLSTIVECNQIIVMKDGCMAECGTHAQLLALNGLYADMWNKQATTPDVVSEVVDAAAPKAP